MRLVQLTYMKAEKVSDIKLKNHLQFIYFGCTFAKTTKSCAHLPPSSKTIKLHLSSSFVVLVVFTRNHFKVI